MMTAPDFQKKQIVFVFFNEGEKIAFSNENMVVKDSDGKVKMQLTCFRLFLIFAVGPFSITSVLLQNARKYGFFVVLMTSGFRLLDIIGAEKEGNTLLHRKQYAYDDLALAKHIVCNKIANQSALLKENREKSDSQKDAIVTLAAYRECVPDAVNLHEIMAYEGMASRLFFKNHFNRIAWKGRQPRLKRDAVNATLDIGYTVLFAFVDALLECFGFDVFCGVMHIQYYMRKSLVCDIVEPFRCLIDKQIKKSCNLKQIREDDFLVVNHQYRLKWEKSADYIRFLAEPLILNKDSLFLYVQSYYRAFMKGLPAEEFPVFHYNGGTE